MLGLGKKTDDTSANDQPKIDQPTQAKSTVDLSYPNDSIVPAEKPVEPEVVEPVQPAVEPAITPTPTQETQTITEPAVLTPITEPVTQDLPKPEPQAAIPAQPVGFIDDDTLETQAAPAQGPMEEPSVASTKGQELQALIERQAAGKAQDLPLQPEPVEEVTIPKQAKAEEPETVPDTKQTPTPMEESVVEPSLPPAAPVLDKAAERETTETAAIEAEKNVEVAEPMPKQPFAEVEKKEVVSSDQPLESRVAALESKIATLEKQVSQWV